VDGKVILLGRQGRRN